MDRVIVTIQDVSHEAGFDDQGHFSGWLRELLHKVPRIITGSEFTRCEMVRLLDLAPERISVIPHGVDHALFYPRPFSAVPLGRDFVVMGAVAKRKNYEQTLKAFGWALRQLPTDTRLIVCGGAFNWKSWRAPACTCQ